MTDPNDPVVGKGGYVRVIAGEIVSTPNLVGLTKREYFAVMVLQGLCVKPQFNCESDAALSVRYADALIEALNAKVSP